MHPGGEALMLLIELPVLHAQGAPEKFQSMVELDTMTWKPCTRRSLTA